MPDKEYFVTKLSFRDDGYLIKDVFAYDYVGGVLSAGEAFQRQWLVNKTAAQEKISVMTRNDRGQWIRGTPFTYNNGLFTWNCKIPKNLPKRKAFISYYHRDDQFYRDRFDSLFGDLTVSKSVADGDIDSDNSDHYIKQLIQKQYLFDTTVLVVLLGANTQCRKHVDWEISGALNYKVGDRYSGLLGLFLPTHPNFGSDNYTLLSIPKRLEANRQSGYAILRDWTEDRVVMQRYIEEAFNNRSLADKIKNDVPQMTKDTNGYA